MPLSGKSVKTFWTELTGASGHMAYLRGAERRGGATPQTDSKRGRGYESNEPRDCAPPFIIPSARARVVVPR